jgi:hypothetical protein
MRRFTKGQHDNFLHTFKDKYDEKKETHDFRQAMMKEKTWNKGPALPRSPLKFLGTFLDTVAASLTP